MCEYKRLDENIKEYMLRTDKADDEKKIFFIFCMNNIGVFYKYYVCSLLVRDIYVFHKSLKKNFDNEDNIWDKKRVLFGRLCQENKNIFIIMYNLKKNGFIIVFR